MMRNGKLALKGLTKEEKDKIKEDKKEEQKEKAKQKRMENKEPKQSKKKTKRKANPEFKYMKFQRKTYKEIVYIRRSGKDH
jgi:hypothetical protein